MTVALLFAALGVLLLLNVPIAVALGLSTALALLHSGLPLTLVVQRMIASNDSFSLMAIPFFILAGAAMTHGGVSRRLVAFADSLFGWMIGGLGIVAQITGVFFSAISGSSAATTAAVGGIIFPEMEKRGYDRSFSAAIVAASGETGIVIPPSVPLVVYGVVAGVSIGDLFLGGVGPGLLMGVALCLLIYGVSRRRGYGGGEFKGFAAVWTSFREAIWGLLMPVIILGGIYGGVFTATEAAVVAVFYGFFVGFAVYRDLKISHLPKIFETTVTGTAVVMFIMNAAGLFSWVITREQFPSQLAAYFISLTSDPIVFLMLINVLLFAVGCILNASAAITILAPILVPIVTRLGIDPVFFGVIMTANLAIGCLTPPVGVDLFIASGIAKVPITRLSRAILPFLAVLIAVQLTITYFPAITMALPHAMK
ncbi:TRAP dicarboxylate transporter, DctM subunit [uncultured Alphaproteobacteria bacterium]|uniref:TRAP transporter large permease protein n=1 Tax=uncultured Alphaproteobacteria bacterium TaxID=91750 RepID=A0A212J9T6_9PROT|nr:TRAP dicarboxylate transporter, DctM subunit [uncultured Alphaproteobacteria bacterium]